MAFKYLLANSVKTQPMAIQKCTYKTSKIFSKTIRLSTFQQQSCFMSQQQPITSTDLPKFFYLQNPLTWARNRLQLKMLKLALDPEFDELQFKSGVKQVILKYRYSCQKFLSSNSTNWLYKCAIKHENFCKAYKTPNTKPH